MINRDVIEGKWKEIKGEIMKTWGELTEDEVDRAKGDITSLSGRLQQRYGYAKDEVSARINDIMRKYENEDEVQTRVFKGKRAENQNKTHQKW
jgi:uncharacterized protein YjbJ (UPF0337 family)